MALVECSVGGIEFTGVNWIDGDNFCSPNCFNLRRQTPLLIPSSPLEERECYFCGGEFSPRHESVKYCSDECAATSTRRLGSPDGYIYEKLVRNMRTRLSGALKRNPKSDRTMTLIGCTVEELRAWLQRQWKRGMTWDNLGSWHIDHVIPCYYFDLSNPYQQRTCFHFHNLQPLWARENLQKHITIKTPQLWLPL